MVQAVNCYYIIQKQKLEIESENQIKNQKQQPEEERKSREEIISGGEVWQGSRALLCLDCIRI